MRVVLGEFACFCVRSQFPGSDLAPGVQSAVRHYVRRLRSSRPPLPLPRFRRGDEQGVSTELDVAMEPAVVDSLRSEARRRSVDLQEILNHAVFVYIADLDRDRNPLPAGAEEAPASAR